MSYSKVELVAEVTEATRKKLRRMQNDAGFGDKSLGEYLTHLTRDTYLADSVGEMIQRGTRDGLLKLWLQNMVHNLPDMWIGESISALVPAESKALEAKGEDPGVPVPGKSAIVIGRGPSLFKHKHLELLANSDYRGTIITSDGALLDALKAGVRPDKYDTFLSVTVDGSPIITKWYDDPLVEKYGENIKAAVCCTVSPSVVTILKKAKVTPYWFQPLFDDYRQIESMTKVEQFITMSEKHPNGIPCVMAGGNCLTGDTIIFKNPGEVARLQDIKVGDRIYGLDSTSEEMNLETGQVTGFYPQGKQDVYEMRTRTRKVEATEGHRFMAYDIELNRFVWKELKHLKLGDYLLLVREIEQKGMPAYFEDYGYTDKFLMKIVGCHIGDGYVRSERGELHLCLPVGDKSRTKYVDLLKTVLGVEKVYEYENDIVVYSKKVGRLFDKMEVGKTAATKTIPDWVFRLPRDQKLGLIEGYLDSDGHLGARGEMNFECVSKELMERLRALMISVGMRPSNIKYRERRIMKITRGKQYYYLHAKNWGFRVVGHGLVKDHNWEFKRSVFQIFDSRTNGRTARVTLKLPSHLWIEKIRSIKPLGQKDVYDMTVEGHHSFLADGLVTHNSGAFCWIMSWLILRRANVALIGMDMGYLPEDDLSKTYYWKTMLEGLKNNVPAVMNQYTTIHNPDFSCDAVLDPVFYTYRQSFLDMAEITPNWLKTNNCTEGGSLFGEGIVPMKFVDWLEVNKT